MKKYFLLSLAAMVVLGCGIKGPPLPPLEEKPTQEIMEAAAQPYSGDDTKKIEKKTKK